MFIVIFFDIERYNNRENMIAKKTKEYKVCANLSEKWAMFERESQDVAHQIPDIGNVPLHARICTLRF